MNGSWGPAMPNKQQQQQHGHGQQGAMANHANHVTPFDQRGDASASSRPWRSGERDWSQGPRGGYQLPPGYTGRGLGGSWGPTKLRTEHITWDDISRVGSRPKPSPFLGSLRGNPDYEKTLQILKDREEAHQQLLQQEQQHQQHPQPWRPRPGAYLGGGRYADMPRDDRRYPQGPQGQQQLQRHGHGSSSDQAGPYAGGFGQGQQPHANGQADQQSERDSW